MGLIAPTCDECGDYLVAVGTVGLICPSEECAENGR